MKVVARPRSPFTFEFSVEVDGHEHGSFRHRAFRPGGTARLGGTDFEIQPAGAFAWMITGRGDAEARIERVAPVGRSYRLSWSGGGLDMVRTMFGLRTVLVSEGEEVGVVGLRSFFTRTLAGEFPPEVPLPAVALGLWNLVRLRRRAAGG